MVSGLNRTHIHDLWIIRLDQQMRNWIIGLVLLSAIPGCVDAPESKQSCILYSNPVNGDYIPSFRITGRSKEAVIFDCEDQPSQYTRDSEYTVGLINGQAKWYSANDVLSIIRNKPIYGGELKLNYTIANEEAAKELGIIQ
jgi:hypothetical protein